MQTILGFSIHTFINYWTDIDWSGVYLWIRSPSCLFPPVNLAHTNWDEHSTNMTQHNRLNDAHLTRRAPRQAARTTLAAPDHCCCLRWLPSDASRRQTTPPLKKLMLLKRPMGGPVRHLRGDGGWRAPAWTPALACRLRSVLCGSASLQKNNSHHFKLIGVSAWYSCVGFNTPPQTVVNPYSYRVSLVFLMVLLSRHSVVSHFSCLLLRQVKAWYQEIELLFTLYVTCFHYYLSNYTSLLAMTEQLKAASSVLYSTHLSFTYQCLVG